ncbi:MAG: tyrosine-type recombinase/integrase [Psychrobacillus sp.]
MAKLGNVVMLNQNSETATLNPFETIDTFLSRKGQNSVNTRETYERAIRDFFRTMRNKELEQLTVQDLIFEKSQVEAYQVKLKDHYKGATVNNAITAIKQCYEKLEDNKFPVQSSWFKLERYDEHDSEKYDTLTHEEVLSIIELVSKTRKGVEKALLVRLAYATAFRRESLLTARWNQIEKINDQWCLKVLGKGNKWRKKKLSDDLYSTLMSFKGEKNDDDKIFELTKKTVTKMMSYIRDNMDFGDRKIVFHSLKKASLNEVNIITGGDLKAIQAQGDHEDVSTSLNSYIADKEFEDLVTIDINTHIPTEAFDALSQKDFVNLVKSMDRNTQIKLLRKIGAM